MTDTQHITYQVDRTPTGFAIWFDAIRLSRGREMLGDILREFCASLPTLRSVAAEAKELIYKRAVISELPNSADMERIRLALAETVDGRGELVGEVRIASPEFIVRTTAEGTSTMPNTDEIPPDYKTFILEQRQSGAATVSGSGDEGEETLARLTAYESTSGWHLTIDLDLRFQGDFFEKLTFMDGASRDQKH